MHIIFFRHWSTKPRWNLHWLDDDATAHLSPSEEVKNIREIKYLSVLKPRMLFSRAGYAS